MWSWPSKSILTAVLLIFGSAGAAAADACNDAGKAVRDRLDADVGAEYAPDLFDALDTACEGDPDHDFSFFSLAIDTIDRRRFHAARRALDRYNAARVAEGRPPEHQIAARLAARQGDWPQAEAELRELYRFYEGRPDIVTSERAQVLESLAEARRNQGDRSGARGLLEQALAIREQAQGPRHANVGDAVARIADIVLEEGDAARAVDLYHRAIGYYTGQNERRQARLRGQLARALARTGDLDGAEREARHAIRLDDLGFRSEAEARDRRRTLAYVLGMKGDTEGAVAALGPAEDVAGAAIRGDSLPDAIALADLFWQGRAYPYAAYFYARAHTLAQRTSPPGHPTRVNLQINAGHAWLFSGQPTFAIDSYRRVEEELAAVGPRPSGERYRRAQVFALWAAARMAED